MRIEFKRKWVYLYFCLDKRKFSFRVCRIPNSPLQGIPSRCKDGSHVLFFDYDRINYDLMVEDYLRLQRKYKLPQALVFATHVSESCGKFFGNFHVVCLKKHLFYDTVRILREAHIDPKYIEMFRRNHFKNWVLRYSPKGDRPSPVFVDVIGEDVNRHFKCSLSHHKFFKRFYNIDVLNDLNFDSNKCFTLVNYTTWR